MVLRMANPTKHPKSGIYYFKVRIPADLVGQVGKKFTTKSLGTKDPYEAKVLFASELQIAHRRWEALRHGPKAIPHKQLVALAGKHYRASMAALEAEPGETKVWDALGELHERVGASPDSLRAWYGSSAERIFHEEGLNADDVSFQRLLEELHAASIQWAEQQLKRSEGDYSPDPRADRFPNLDECAENGTSIAPKITLSHLFSLWERDHLSEGKTHRTVKDFRQKLQSFIDFSGHEDAQRVTPKDVMAWCEHLRHEKQLKAKTVSTKYLAALKAIYRVGIAKFEIETDPTQNTKVAYNKRKKRERSAGFTDKEALAILQASLRDPATLGGMSERNKLAVRWGPWICAFTGARVGEVMQLRREDLIVEHGIHCLRITPEAGSTKSGNYRVVPLHPQLLELGLPDFVRGRPEGPLFYLPKITDDDPVKRAGNAAKKVGKWIRDDVGITDRRLQPNHAWRHRFKTLARDFGIAPEYMDALQGHEDGRASTAYGEITVRALLREVEKLPRAEL